MDKAYEAYLNSDAFHLFLDKTLRDHACEAVEELCGNYGAKDFITTSQLHSIPAAIQSGGKNALTRLIDHQRQKNSNEKKKVFWNFMSNQISRTIESRDCLYMAVKDQLASFLEDEISAGDDKPLRNKIKKMNKNKIDSAISKVLSVYCEHLTSHYAYCAALNSVSPPERRE